MSLTIPCNVSVLGINPFLYCYNLELIEFDSDEYFINDEGIIRTNSETNSEVICYMMNLTTPELLIPSSCSKLREYSIFANLHLEIIYLMASVTHVSDYSIGNCTSLNKVFHYSEDPFIECGKYILYGCQETTSLYVYMNYDITKADGFWLIARAVGKSGDIYFYKNSGELFFYGLGYMEESYESEESKGGSNAPWIQQHSSINSVIFYYGVKSISSFAFYCSPEDSDGYPIKTVYINNEIERIGDVAFGHCKNIEKITIPSTVTSLGDNPFAGCSSLTDITLENNQNYIYDKGIITTKKVIK